MDKELTELSEAIAAACRSKALLLATAESCTGGWAAQVITHTAGSSAWFDRGFVTYSNAAKTEMLGVPVELIQKHGAVSPEVARAMAEGAITHSRAACSLAITGIAGPSNDIGGGSSGKPVGTVCFAWCRIGESANSEIVRFGGNREEVRRQAVVHALSGVLRRILEEGWA